MNSVCLPAMQHRLKAMQCCGAARNLRTGQEIWAARLDCHGQCHGWEYLGRDGKRYVVIGSRLSGPLKKLGRKPTNNTDTLIAFAVSDRAIPDPFGTA